MKFVPVALLVVLPTALAVPGFDVGASEVPISCSGFPLEVQAVPIEEFVVSAPGCDAAIKNWASGICGIFMTYCLICLDFTLGEISGALIYPSLYETSWEGLGDTSWEVHGPTIKTGDSLRLHAGKYTLKVGSTSGQNCQVTE